MFSGEHRSGNGSVMRKEHLHQDLNIWFDKDAIFEDLDFGVRVVKDHRWIASRSASRLLPLLFEGGGFHEHDVYQEHSAGDT